MKIRIINRATVRLDLQPGDEIAVQSPSPELENLLTSTRADGEKYAELVTDDGSDGTTTATVQPAGQTATTGRGQRREPRPQTVPQ